MELNTSIPIIGLTANVFREDIEDCLNAGMNDHLGKPYNQEQLYCAIEKWYVKKLPDRLIPPMSGMKD